MGIINITPDSFSDGGKYNSAETFARRFRQLLKYDNLIIDIGAESTAPQNSSVGPDIEKRRFKEITFPFLSTLDITKKITLSIDTCSIDTFKYVYKKIYEYFPQAHLIWNDVSGIFNHEVKLFLANNSNVSYIFCHTLVPRRDLISQHMEYLFTGSNEELLESIVTRFQEVIPFFQENLNIANLYLDPCFGFSKTYEQNCFLIKNLSKMVESFPVDQKWVVGISRKSFLKKQALTLQMDVEDLHQTIIERWMCTLNKHKLVFRVHRPNLLFG